MWGRNCGAPSRLTVNARNLDPVQQMVGVDPMADFRPIGGE
jgi:hypothetical protein